MNASVQNFMTTLKAIEEGQTQTSKNSDSDEFINKPKWGWSAKAKSIVVKPKGIGPFTSLM